MSDINEQTTWNILMVDDDEDDYLLVRNMLSDAKQGKCTLIWASTYEDGRQALQCDQYDAVLMDYDLGAHNGLELIREGTAKGIVSPFILFTGRGSYEVDMEALQAGVSMYLTKGETSPLMLERGIRYAIERKYDQMLLAQQEEALRKANAELKHELLRREQVEMKLQVLLDRQQLLYEAATELLAGADPLERLDAFFQRVSHTLGLEIFVQYNVSADGSHLEIGKQRGFPEQYLPILARLEFGQAVCGTVALTRKPVYVNDVQHSYDRKVRLIRSMGVSTYACHPLIVEGQLLGTLSFGSRTHNRFEPETIDLLRTFCNLVAHALIRKKHEQSLRQREEHFRTLADNIAQLAWMADDQGNRFWFNKGWVEYTGAALEDSQGWGWTNSHHPQHLPRVVERVKQSLVTGAAWEDTFPLRSKDGQWRWFLTRCVPVCDENGKVIRWFGTNTDITQQRETEEALKIKQMELSNAYEELEVANEELVATNNDLIERAREERDQHFESP